MGTQEPWRKAHEQLRLKVGHRHSLAQVGQSKGLVGKVSIPDQKGREQLVLSHSAAMTRQPCRPPCSLLISETCRSQSQGQEPRWVLRFAKGPRAPSFLPKDGELPHCHSLGP